ncbi:MAG: hypothetical protein M1562_00760 [Candidatus Marsarchaeota archaeon]|jgi:hypothetical protein|nr:hypothetical protein [Candidatus Marsarchaeota archaeon]
MSIKYWEFEDAPFKNKVKSPNVREIAKIFFDNETEAYRFGLLLLEVKRRGKMRLKEAPSEIPIATAKRYLDKAVEFGILKHESSEYSLTNRYTRPLVNISAYISEWMKSDAEEDISIEFVNAKQGRQQKRGGREPQTVEG